MKQHMSNHHWVKSEIAFVRRKREAGSYLKDVKHRHVPSIRKKLRGGVVEKLRRKPEALNKKLRR
jgi:hypothetical protein